MRFYSLRPHTAGGTTNYISVNIHHGISF